MAAMTPPPTALTPEEQATYQKFIADASARSSVYERDNLRDVGAIIRRLDAEIARLDALVRHAEADCVILRDRAVEASGEGIEFLRQRDALARALEFAKDTIHVWHSIKDPDDETWNLYQESPEMKQINAALARVRGSGA